MILSISVFVRSFVRPSVPFFSFVSLESEVHLEVGVSRVLQGCFKDVSWVSQVGFKGILRWFKGVLRVFKERFKDI